MPHAASHDSDFAGYVATRKTVLTRITELRCYYLQLEQAVKEMPDNTAGAGYLDLDNLQQLEGSLTDDCNELDWDGLDMEFARLELPSTLAYERAHG